MKDIEPRLYLYYLDTPAKFTPKRRIRRWFRINPKTQLPETTVDSGLVPAVEIGSKESLILEELRKTNPNIKRRVSQRQGRTCQRKAAHDMGQALGNVAMIKTQVKRLHYLGILDDKDLAAFGAALALATQRIEDRRAKSYE